MKRPMMRKGSGVGAQLLRGLPHRNARVWNQNIRILQSKIPHCWVQRMPNPFLWMCCVSCRLWKNPGLIVEIPRVHQLDFLRFQAHYLKQQIPVIITVRVWRRRWWMPFLPGLMIFIYFSLLSLFGGFRG